jgi:putative intracellular protease/amidase
MQHALLVLTSHDRLGDTGQLTGWYVPEAAHPWARFRAAGMEVEFTSEAGGFAPLTGFDPTDEVQAAFLAEYGPDGPDTIKAGDVNPADFDAVLYVGGHGTMWDFPTSPDIARVTEAIHAQGGVVAAVCHGPAGLLRLRDADGRPLVAGKRVAAFTNSEEEAVGLIDVVPFLLADSLVALGATHVPAPDFTANIVVDGRLVTGQNPASAEGVADAIIELVERVGAPR